MLGDVALAQRVAPEAHANSQAFFCVGFEHPAEAIFLKMVVTFWSVVKGQNRGDLGVVKARGNPEANVFELRS